MHARSSLPRFLPLALAIAASLALAACGGGDGGDSGGDGEADAIAKQIEFAATSGDPKACTTAQTQNFNNQNEGDATGAAALKSCEANAGDNAAESVVVSNIQVDGDSATADAAPKGSPFDGQTVEFGLVKEEGLWKIDSLNKFTEFNRAAFTKTFKEALTQDGSLPADALACVDQQIAAASDETLENAVLEPSGFEKIFAPCG